MAYGKPGPPRKFTPEQWADAVYKYYESITYEEPLYKLVETGGFNAKGKPLYERVPLMIERDGKTVQATKISFTEPPSALKLSLALGINKNTYSEYHKLDGYKETCDWWAGVCETYDADLLHTKEGNVQGVLAVLKNHFGWTDKQEVQVSGGIEKYLEKLNEGSEGKNGQRL